MQQRYCQVQPHPVSYPVSYGFLFAFYSKNDDENWLTGYLIPTYWISFSFVYEFFEPLNEVQKKMKIKDYVSVKFCLYHICIVVEIENY